MKIYQGKEFVDELQGVISNAKDENYVTVQKETLEKVVQLVERFSEELDKQLEIGFSIEGRLHEKTEEIKCYRKKVEYYEGMITS